MLFRSGPFLNVGLGALHACGQKTDGTFSCWGDSQSGQYGGPDGADLEPHLQGGYTHTCALQTDGQLVCWGESASFSAFPTD